MALLIAAALTVGGCDSCACGGAPQEPVSEAGGAGESARVQGIALSEGDFAGAAIALPRPDQLDDFVYVGPPATYGSDELAELLGDEAAAFVDLGVEEAAHGALQSVSQSDDAGEAIALDVYLVRMSSPPAAQQRWDAEREGRSCEQSDELSRQHCLSATRLDLVRGPWYMRFEIDGDARPMQASLVEVARTVLAQMDELMRGRRPMAPSQP